MIRPEMSESTLYKPQVAIYPDKTRQFGFSVRFDRSSIAPVMPMKMYTNKQMGDYKPIKRAYNVYNYAWVK